MEIVGIKARQASFTVEAVFVMTITIWIIASICYLSVYSHDRIALYSLAENYLEQAVENGKDFTEASLQSGLKAYLQNHMMLSRIESVSVRRGVVSVCAEIRFRAEVSLPLARRLLAADSEKRISVSHEVLFAPNYMWDSEILREQGKDGDRK